MSNAGSGHGALIAIEKDGAAAGTFTTVAELNSDISFGLSRAETEVTPHNDNIDAFIANGVLRREPMTFSVNFIFDNDTHDGATGLQKRLVDNDKFGVRLRGPGATGPTNEVIGSGYLTSFVYTDPVREGARSAEVTFRFTGKFKRDGTEIGTVD